MSIFFIAEIGINHTGDLSIVKDLIDVAVSVGCDAVKFQKAYRYELFTRILDSLRESPWGLLERSKTRSELTKLTTSD